jgi:hypothetical protein
VQLLATLHVTLEQFLTFGLALFVNHRVLKNFAGLLTFDVLLGSEVAGGEVVAEESQHDEAEADYVFGVVDGL